MPSQRPWILRGVVAVSLCLNVAQGARLLSLRAQVAHLGDDPALAVGTKLPVLDALDLQNRAVSVAMSEPTIVYWMSPKCVWSRRNENNLLALATQTAGRWRIRAVSATSEGLTEFVRKHPTPFPTLHQPREGVKKAYRFGGTPMVIVVGGDGRVLKVWWGAWTDRNKSEIESFFHCNLPGLSPIPPGNPAS